MLDELTDNDLVVLDALARGASSLTAIKKHADGALSHSAIRKVLSGLAARGMAGWRLDDTWRIRRSGSAALRGEAHIGSSFTLLISDPTIRKAVGSIQRRSERQEDIDQLAITFVDPGVVDQLDNANNQVVYGRRGTGKTHVLRVLGRALSLRPRQTTLYLDLRTLGSSSIYEDAQRPLHARVTALLKDLLAEVHDALLDYATGPGAKDNTDAFQALDQLASAITRSSLTGEKLTLQDHAAHAKTDGAEVGVVFSTAPQVSMAARSDVRQEYATDRMREGTPLDHIMFAEITAALVSVLELSELRRFHLFLDEWTAIPLDLQPLLAEFLKRTLFTVPRITVKIATLEYRSNFALSTGRNNRIGFELGADISTSLELDDYFVYDRSPKGTSKTFSELLYRHVGVEADLETSSQATVGSDGRKRSLQVLKDSMRIALREDEAEPTYLLAAFGIDGADALVNAMFDSRTAFGELAKASEGVARDFINIFSSAYFAAVRQGAATIDTATVRTAAQSWFETDKAPNVSGTQHALLDHIIREVIGKRRARTFLLEQEYVGNDLIQSLFDLRLLHLVQRGYADPTAPTRRFNIYTLDYGFYVALMGTQRAPSGDFTKTPQPSGESLVAVDDRRFIRRIVLDPEDLDRLSPKH
jgi:hypothetical protein